ncbi:MAG: DUF2470 domain-containing protein, partial [Mesorhizobium sp.]
YQLDQSDLLTSGPIVEELATREQSAIDHMNADHVDAIAVYAQHFARASGNGWRVAGFDADGMDLVSGDDVCRVFYPQPLVEAGELRHVLIDMAKAGRAIVDAGTET